AGPAGHHVSVIAAEQSVGALAAGDYVVAITAVDGETDRAGGERRGIDGVVAVAAVDDQSVLCGLGVEDGDRRRRAGYRDRAIDAADVDRVVVGFAVDRHGIHRAVAAVEIDGNPTENEVRAADVVDGDVVRAAKRPEDDSLDAVEIHCDVVNVTGEDD